MHGTQKILGGIVLVAVALALVLIPQASSQSAGAAQTGNAEPVPAYHKELPEGPLPETLAPSLFDKVIVRNAYSVAAITKKILYQQPCYCHCDVHEGHGSLLDCFVSNHTAGCGVCMKEVFYVYEQKHNGKAAAQIREGIEQGEWKKVDLKKYEVPLSVK